MKFEHKSVLLSESLAGILTDHAGIYVDCTLGGGGHALAFTQQLSSTAWFVGIDQDPAAVAAGRARLESAPCKVSIIQSNFQDIDQVLADLGIQAIDGVLFDLGVSSHQLDVAERGFSYMQDGPLDMRMDPAAKLSAHGVVNSYSAERLTEVIGNFGEERWAKRIASFIVQARTTQPVNTTGDLCEIIKKAIPAAARRDGPHPAKRTFQAIRIEVNDELGILQKTFEIAVDKLKIGGRIGIITFHSLEDRIAKQTLQHLAKGCICPKAFPICICQNKPKVKIIGKPVVPSTQEVADNPRARSAKLRVAEKIQ